MKDSERVAKKQWSQREGHSQLGVCIIQVRLSTFLYAHTHAHENYLHKHPTPVAPNLLEVADRDKRFESHKVGDRA